MRKKHDFKESQRVLIVVLLFTVIFAVVLSLPLQDDSKSSSDVKANR